MTVHKHLHDSSCPLLTRDGYCNCDHHEYMRRIWLAVDRGLIDRDLLEPNNVMVCNVLHDSSCPLLTRDGYCNCDPFIRIPTANGHIVEVLRDGSTTWFDRKVDGTRCRKA